MKKLKNDLTGKTFSRLYVIGVADTGTRKTYYYCKCVCGKMKTVRSDSLIDGTARSCGCMKLEQDRINLEANHTHKQSGTRLYEIWQGMRTRCYRVTDARYHRYGGRGISICDEWKNDFVAFYDWANKNGYSESLTIDRIDNNGNYDPTNCKWSTAEKQCNNRESNIKITIGNTTKTLTQWCEIFDLEYSAIHARYVRNGFGGIDELFSPTRNGR